MTQKLKLKTIAEKLTLKERTGIDYDGEVDWGYASDLLSDVLARARNNTIWVTNQKHQNIVGVAVMLNLSGVVVAGGIEPDENTIAKAKDENIALFTTGASLFEVAGRLWDMGVRSSC